jgi:uncharacterized protein YggE
MKTIKHTLIVLAFSILGFNAIAQNNQNQIIRKSISVIGTAETEIVPDEIYVSITLQEYKENGNKVVIETLEKAMREVLNTMKIDAKNLTIEGSYGYRNYIPKKHKQKDFFLSKTYQLKMSELSKYNELIDRLDDEGISQVNISRTNHSKMQEFKKQLKINAIKAAKEKASYLLVAINEQLGEALEVNEQGNNEYFPMYENLRANNVSMKVMEGFSSSGSSEDPSIEMKTIKITSQVNVVFAIK